jgi:Ca2+-binding RTX toxin-like protein
VSDVKAQVFALEGTGLATPGDDTLVWTSGEDSIDGLAGDDRLRGVAGKDSLDGGTGVDTAEYSETTAGVFVTLNGATDATVSVGGAPEDTIRNIENVKGGRGNDTLTGDGLANVLSGDYGNDMIAGGDGDDTLIGGPGQDKLDGGVGTDTADYSTKWGSVVVALNGATETTVTVGGVAEDTVRNIENVNGGRGNDILTGDELGNKLSGGGGNDILDGGGGVDNRLYGGAGADLFRHRPGGGADQIFDFEDNVDTIDLRGYGFASVADALRFAVEEGAVPSVTFEFSRGTFDFPVGDMTLYYVSSIEQLADDVLIVGKPLETTGPVGLP